MMSSDFLEIRNLSKSFIEGDRNRLILNSVSLNVKAGESVALLGRSGSGKSTLLNLISGIDQPDAGSIAVAGTELTALSEKDLTLFRRHHIGFVYQFFHLLPGLSVADNIRLVLELQRMPRSDIDIRVAQLLQLIGLADRANSYPDRLSGGEQQRVAVARAIAHRPQIVLADEPTGNLDAETGARVLALLHRLVGEDNVCLILVTHSLAVAKSAGRVMTLEQSLLAEREGEFAW